MVGRSPLIARLCNRSITNCLSLPANYLVRVNYNLLLSAFQILLCDLAKLSLLNIGKLLSSKVLYARMVMVFQQMLSSSIFLTEKSEHHYGL